MSRRMDPEEDDTEPSILSIVVAFIVGLGAVGAVYGLISWLA